VLFIEPFWLCILIPIVVAPISLGASLAFHHWRLPRIDKAIVLSAAGLALASIGGGALFAVVLVALVLFTHRVALVIESAGKEPERARGGLPRARTWLAVAVGVQSATVAAMSRAGIIDGPLRGIRGVLVPFGLSYFAFHGISYLVDVYRRRAIADRSRWQLAVHLILLPQIAGGPLTYESVARQVARRLPSLSDYSYGVRRLIIGAWKVFVMAALAGAQADATFGVRRATLNASQAWLGIVCFTMQMYYAFSGYSDMGIGFGRMLGIRLPENFRWPYVAGSVREFWRRWHIGLSAWFGEYADLSPAPDRVPPLTTAREALVVGLCAVWYGVGWTFVVWGLYHASLIVLERRGLETALKRLPAPLRSVYLLTVVIVGWTVLRSATLGDALAFQKALAGLNPSASQVRVTVDPELWLLLVAGAVGCAPLLPSIRRWTVAIDALIVSILMMGFASVLFTWRCGRMVVMPVVQWWRGTPTRVGPQGGNAL